MSDFRKLDPKFGSLSHGDHEWIMHMIRKGASRREVMGWMMAAGASVAAAGSVFTGASEAWANTPKKGGRLVPRR